MKTLRRTALAAAILLGACGGSSDGEEDVLPSDRPEGDAPVLEDETGGPPSEPAPTTPPATETGSEPDGSASEPGTDPGPETDPGSETDAGSETDPGSETDSGSGSEPGAELNPSLPGGNPSVPDPMSPNATSVSFEITVPAYVSDELQVRITWGERMLMAVWNGDESWSAVGDFPTDEERLLVVDFLDRNGELPLGTFERDFRTGTDAGETYTVGAGNFDTARWDSDRDGVSNIDELRSGTDPLAEGELFGLVEGPPSTEEATPLGVVERVSAFYEASLPKTRPYVESVEVLPEDPEDFGALRATRRVDIDIDAAGTGRFSRFVETRNEGDEDIRRLTFEATRTAADGIDWSGTYAMSVSSAGLSERFTFETETRAVGERISQKGDIERDATLNVPVRRTDIEYELIGERIAGTPRCEPVAGEVIVQERSDLAVRDPSETPLNTRYLKELTESGWRVETRYEDGSLQGSRLDSLGIELYCDFGEL